MCVTRCIWELLKTVHAKILYCSKCFQSDIKNCVVLNFTDDYIEVNKNGVVYFVLTNNNVLPTYNLKRLYNIDDCMTNYFFTYMILNTPDGKSYVINLKMMKKSFYMVGNCIDKQFINMYVRAFCGVQNRIEKYELNILDHKMVNLVLNEESIIHLNSDDYSVY